MSKKPIVKMISNRAAVQRINRALAPNKIMRFDRRTDVWKNYVIDTTSGTIESYIDDVDAYGRKLGVIKAWEKLED